MRWRKLRAKKLAAVFYYIYEFCARPYVLGRKNSATGIEERKITRSANRLEKKVGRFVPGYIAWTPGSRIDDLSAVAAKFLIESSRAPLRSCLFLRTKKPTTESYYRFVHFNEEDLSRGLQDRNESHWRGIIINFFLDASDINIYTQEKRDSANVAEYGTSEIPRKRKS